MIEGIGALDEVFLPRVEHPDRFYDLVCFKNKGVIITVSYDGMLPPLLGPATCLLSVDNLVADTKAVIVPNPVDETSKLRFKTAVSGTLIITNTIGQIVATEVLQQSQEVLIGSRIHLRGVYYYCLRAKEGEVMTGTFIKTD